MCIRDRVINILDATNLERNLVLTQQLVEESVPMVIALNMLDVAEQQGVKIDIDTLRENLGIDVYPIVASRAEGVEALSQKLEAYLTDLKNRCRVNPLTVFAGRLAQRYPPSALPLHRASCPLFDVNL